MATIDAPALPDTLPVGLVPLTFLVGRWERGDTAEHWVAAGDVLFGVSLTRRGDGTPGFEVLKVQTVDGRARYVAQPNGAAPTAFPLASVDRTQAVFLNPEHDDPQRIRYTRDAARMEAGVGPATGEETAVFRWKARPAASASELEAADRAFAADVASRGVDAWIDAFDPAGTQWSESGGVAVRVGPEMRALMAPTLAGALAWEPVHSGLNRKGDLGYTVGDWTWTAPGADAPSAKGAYVTIWREQPDGSWKVWFDTGDAIDR